MMKNSSVEAPSSKSKEGLLEPSHVSVIPLPKKLTNFDKTTSSPATGKTQVKMQAI
jgi:hypothetical protein